MDRDNETTWKEDRLKEFLFEMNLNQKRSGQAQTLQLIIFILMKSLFPTLQEI